MGAVNKRVRAVVRNPEQKERFLVLLNKRAQFGKITLMLPGGGIEGSETPIAALQREIKEELGVSISLGIGNCKYLGRNDYEFPAEKGGDVSNVSLYFYRVDDFYDVPRNMEEDKVASVSWVTLADCERLVGVVWDEQNRVYQRRADAEENFVAQLGFFEMVRCALDCTAPAKAASQPVDPSPETASRAPAPLAYEQDSLEEAGGLVSWLKRSFTNTDSGIEFQIREELAHISTEAERQRIIKELDDFISEARIAEKEGTLGDVLRSLGFGGASGAAGFAAGWFKGTATAPQVTTGFAAIINRLMGQGVVTTAQRTAHILKAANSAAFSAAVAGSLVALTLKSIYRYNGSLDQYILGLQALRQEVAVYRIPKQG